jgi:organic radical activating enzyme
MRELIVSEVFGPTLQGEGPTAGQPTMFVRLGLCNLSCAWCDTPYTWDWTGKNGRQYVRSAELVHRNVDDVLDELHAAGCGRLVITGGEPMLQPDGVRALADGFLGDVEVETNGTMMPPPELAGIRWNVSPKLHGSGDVVDRRIVPAVLSQFAMWARDDGDVTFKFVITDDADVAELDELVVDMALTHVCVMPEGRDAQTILDRARWLAPIAIERGWALSTRLHVLLWGDERGR